MNTEICDECGRTVTGRITTGDRGGGPSVCMKCYWNPGWYHDADLDQDAERAEIERVVRQASATDLDIVYDSEGRLTRIVLDYE